MRTANARILIATAGTWGDLLPFVELGRRLISRGHDVTIACSTGLHSWVERAGLKPVAFDGDFGKEKAQRLAKQWNHWGQAGSEAKGKPSSSRSNRGLADLFERNSRALAKLAADADLLLTPTNCPEGRLAYELSGIAWLSVMFIPEDAFQPQETADERFIEAMNESIRRLGLSDSLTTSQSFKRSRPTLLACSRMLGQVDDPELCQTGFWFYEDPEWPSWQPSDELLRFMEDGEPPLVLSFSSLPLEDPRRVLEVHVRAAQILGRRLVVQQGWSGFLPNLLPAGTRSDQVYMADFLPHDWFFSRAAGLMTHGGIGTLGRALRNGCPVLVEPYGNDQFFNALLMKKLGYGSAAHPARVTPESLAHLIQDKVLNDEVRQRVTAAAIAIRQEDGLGDATKLIERRLEGEIV